MWPAWQWHTSIFSEAPKPEKAIDSGSMVRRRCVAINVGTSEEGSGPSAQAHAPEHSFLPRAITFPLRCGSQKRFTFTMH